ncbi:hypothetical protein GVAV_001831 [Gurleya vavrai]
MKFLLVFRHFFIYAASNTNIISKNKKLINYDKKHEDRKQQTDTFSFHLLEKKEKLIYAKKELDDLLFTKVIKEQVCRKAQLNLNNPMLSEDRKTLQFKLEQAKHNIKKVEIQIRSKETIINRLNSEIKNLTEK